MGKRLFYERLIERYLLGRLDTVSFTLVFLDAWSVIDPGNDRRLRRVFDLLDSFDDSSTTHAEIEARLAIGSLVGSKDAIARPLAEAERSVLRQIAHSLPAELAIGLASQSAAAIVVRERTRTLDIFVPRGCPLVPLAPGQNRINVSITDTNGSANREVDLWFIGGALSVIELAGPPEVNWDTPPEAGGGVAVVRRIT